MDAAGREAAERIEGALWFRGPSTTAGYFRNDEDSRALFPEGSAAGWLDSGDRAYRADGEFFITGRVKDIVLKAGRNLYPHEVEEITARVKEACVKGCVVAFGAQPDAASGTERLIVAAETLEKDAASRQPDHARNRRPSLAGNRSASRTRSSSCLPVAFRKTSSGKLRRDQTPASLIFAGELGAKQPPAWLQAAKLAAASAAQAARSWPRRTIEVLYGIYALSVFACVDRADMARGVHFAPSRKFAARLHSSSALRVHFGLTLVGCRVSVHGARAFGHRDRSGKARSGVQSAPVMPDVLVLIAALGAWTTHFVARARSATCRSSARSCESLAISAFGPQRHARPRLQQEEQIEYALKQGESVFVFPGGHVHAAGRGATIPSRRIQGRRAHADPDCAFSACGYAPIAPGWLCCICRAGPRSLSTVCPPLEPSERPRLRRMERNRASARCGAERRIGLHAKEPLRLKSRPCPERHRSPVSLCVSSLRTCHLLPKIVQRHPQSVFEVDLGLPFEQSLSFADIRTALLRIVLRERFKNDRYL